MTLCDPSFVKEDQLNIPEFRIHFTRIQRKPATIQVEISAEWSLYFTSNTIIIPIKRLALRHILRVSGNYFIWLIWGIFIN